MHQKCYSTYNGITSDKSINSNNEIISESDLIEFLDFNEFNIPKDRGYPLYFAYNLKGSQDLYVNTPLREFVKQYPVGVYIWTNKSTGQQYVGSSKVLEERLTEYFNIRTSSKGDTRVFNAIK